MTPLAPQPHPTAPTSVERRLRMARRRLEVARWTQLALLLSVGAGFAVGALMGLDWVALLALFLAMAWVFLVVRSARLVRRVREAWGALQLGRPDLAEVRAAEVLDATTLLRPVTHSALWVLALAASRQGRHAEAAQLAAFVLWRRERLLVGDRNGVQLLLAESLVAMGHLDEARAAALPLYASKLPLADALRLLALQLRLEMRLGDYGSMLDRLGSKVDMADLMSPRDSALVQALLGVASHRAGHEPWAQWLWKRVNLLVDWPALQAMDPGLADVGAGFAPVATTPQISLSDGAGPQEPVRTSG